MTKTLLSIFIGLFLLSFGNTPEVSAAGFDANVAFPTWDEAPVSVEGVLGRNTGTADEQRAIIHFIPTITNLLLKFVAPIIVIMFLYAGIRFIYAGDDDEQLQASKKFFGYAIMGLIFVIISYSLMKGIYFIFK